MGLNKILKFLFIFNSITISIGFVYKNALTSIFQYSNYFFIVLIFLLLFNNKNARMNGIELKIFLISLITALSDVIISFIFDTHNPNFLVSSSLLAYLIFNRLFLEDLEKQFIFFILTLLSFLFLIPSIAPDLGKFDIQNTLYIVRNIPLYSYMILLNISFLNLSKLISNKEIYLRKSKIINFLLFFYLLISSISLFLMFKFYFTALAAIIMNLFTLIAIIFMAIHLLWQRKFLKISIFTLFTISLIYFFNSPYFDEILKSLETLWWINNVAQGSIIDGNYRTDYIGFLRCFLDYPLGTGFYGMEKLCLTQSYYELPDGIQPHNSLVAFFLGYPLISIFVFYYLVFNKKFRNSLILKFLINIPSNKGGLSLGFITFARYFHLGSFLLSIMTSEAHLKYPFF